MQDTTAMGRYGRTYLQILKNDGQTNKVRVSFECNE